MNRIFPAIMERILVVRTGALGDFVVTLPVLRALRRTYPGARLDLLGYPETLALAREEADEIDSIDRADWAPFFVPEGRLPSRCVDLLGDVDLALSYLPDSDGIFTANLGRAGVRKVVSFDPHPPPDGSVHITDHLLHPLKDLGISASDAVPRLRLAQEDRREAEALLLRYGLVDAPFAAIHPGSGGATKRWPTERFAAVADRIARQISVVLFSGPADGDLTEHIAARMRSRPVVIPSPPLRHLAALFSHAAAYLGNDSGPSHLASAVETPAVVLFGPTDPRIWAPRGERVCVLQGDPDLPSECRLNAISEDDVVKAVLGLVSQAERR